MKKLLYIAGFIFLTACSGNDTREQVIRDYMVTEVRGIRADYDLRVNIDKDLGTVTDRDSLEVLSAKFKAEGHDAMKVVRATVSMQDAAGKRSMRETYDFYLSPDGTVCYGKLKSKE